MLLDIGAISLLVISDTKNKIAKHLEVQAIVVWVPLQHRTGISQLMQGIGDNKRNLIVTSVEQNMFKTTAQHMAKNVKHARNIII